jgi:predicted nucleic acid-binding protein
LTSLCSVYLRYAPIRSGCGHGSSLRLATKRYEKSGLKIASICIVNDLLLLTRNLSDFRDLSGLQFENWLD